MRYAEKEVETFDLDYGRQRKERQLKEDKIRKEKWRALTPQQQLEYLDKVFGKGVGAGKQRARIQEKLTNQPRVAKTPKVVPNKPKKFVKWKNRNNNKCLRKTS